MLVDGERIKALVANASREVILCAPFIKVGPLRALLEVVQEGVAISVCTRWRPVEVAAGVSDLEIFEVINALENAELRLLNELHAKLFVADNRCLVGSANITGAALGWSDKPNVELVVAIERADPSVQQLLKRLVLSNVASYEQKCAVEAEAKEIKVPTSMVESMKGSELTAEVAGRWFPVCAAPDKLYRVYRDPQTDAVVEGTREDAVADLTALGPPKGLSELEFNRFIADILRQFPAIQEIFDKVPERLNDERGAELLREIKGGTSEAESRKQWAIVRDWIRVFFEDEFEVAPERYVVRLKRRGK